MSGVIAMATGNHERSLFHFHDIAQSFDTSTEEEKQIEESIEKTVSIVDKASRVMMLVHGTSDY